MGDDMTTAGGGLHPGRPVIWPTGKSAPTAPSPQAAAGTQAGKVAPTPQEIAQAQAAARLIEKTGVSRQFTPADLRELLITQDIADTEANQKLATIMLRYGVEVSKANFAKLSNMMGADPTQTTQEAAIILLMKGIDSPEAVKTLSKFLSENPQLAAQLLALKGNITDLLAALSMAKGIINQPLLSQIAALLAMINDNLDSIPGRYKFSGKGNTGRTELVNDLRSFKALLQGLPGKENLPDSAEGQVIESNMRATENKLDQMIQGIISQALLSKQTQKNEVNYLYYQIPNALTKPPTTAELIVKRDTSEGGKKIDPKNTEIIMSLETENLGRIAVKVTIKDKNVEFLFNTQNDAVKALVSGNREDLAKGLSQKDYNATKVQVNVNPSMCSIKPFLIPFLGIEDLMKIDVSA